MHCPICGQKQLADNVRFCSRCGFLLTGITEVVANNGLVPNQPNQPETTSDSPRTKGVKQGLMILLVGMLLIVPLIAMIHIATDTEPFFMAIAAIISFWGGILRMIYAWLFESKFHQRQSFDQNFVSTAQNSFSGKQNQNALPPEQSISAQEYVAPKAGNWRETNELFEVGSVTDNTTKLLEKED